MNNKKEKLTNECCYDNCPFAYWFSNLIKQGEMSMDEKQKQWEEVSRKCPAFYIGGLSQITMGYHRCKIMIRPVLEYH